MSTKPAPTKSIPTAAPKVVKTTPQKMASAKSAEKPAPVLVKSVVAPKASKLPVKLATAKKSVTKAVKPAKPKPAPKTKVKKPKLVRDSFTIPKPEYLVLDALKARANQLTSPAKKGELLRAGIKALAAMSDAAFLVALKAVPAIKTGRPVKV